MKRPTFFEGVAVAFAASLVAAVIDTVVAPVVPTALLLRGVVAAVGLGYVIYLLARSRAHVGRVTAVALWTAVTGATLLLDPPFVLHVLVQLALVWLIRSLYYYGSILSAIADLGLCAFALAAAAWAAVESGSLFLTVWCLLLVQALFPVIPPDMRRRRRDSPPWEDGEDGEDRFERAHQAAEAALRRLSSAR